MSPPAPPPSACLNCGQPFGQPRPRYCPACAQESNVRPPTLLEFAQQFGGAYLSTEGALWRTLKLLLLRPGELTAQYLAGRRKHYVLPLRLYLTISVLALLVLRLAGGGVVGGLDDPQVLAKLEGKGRNGQIGIVFGRAGFRNGEYFCDNLPGWLCERLRERIDVEPREFLRLARQAGDRLSSNLSAMMFVLMPVFAALLWLLYRNRGLRYTEHLVFALHLHAWCFVVLACMQLAWPPLQVAGLLAMPVYAWLALRRVYGGAWGPRLLRALALLGAYAMVAAVVVAAEALAALLL